MIRHGKTAVGDMTEGSPTGLILRFTLPMMVGNIFQQFYNLVDSIVVGKYVGSNELGGIGCTGSIHYLIFSLGYGIATGIGILTAILLGGKEKERLTRAIYNGFYAVLGASLLITVGGYFGAEKILQWMDTPAELFPYALLYLRVTVLGSAVSMLYNAISAVMRAFGDSKTPLMILVIACLLNIGLDLLLVVVFSMGVLGVAVATIIAQAISAALSFWCASRKLPLFRCTKEALRPDRALLRKCVRLGLPIAGQNVLIAMSCIALQVVVNGFAEQVVTANVAVSKIEQLVQQPYGSLSGALSAYTGQNIGAHRPDRVRRGFRVGIVSMACFSAALVTVVQLFPDQLLSVFVNDRQIIAIGARALRITSPFYIFLGLIYVVRGPLNGAGDTVYSALNGIVELCCRVGMAMPLTRIPAIGMWGCFWCSGLTWMVTGLLSLVRYGTGRWDTVTKRSKMKSGV